MMDSLTLEFIPVDAPTPLPMTVAKSKRKPITPKSAGDNGDTGEAAYSGALNVPNALGTTGTFLQIHRPQHKR